MRRKLQDKWVWHKYYALFPIRICNELVWLEYVYRKHVCRGIYEYRLPEDRDND